ncbi:NAD(P)-dependent oxidoreductase [Spongiibacter nanhainus]|uniref:NAD(P)-dependent oxidoreductase n=1 Tax=Spongiibacter nanhainus TaxID=2794344 RepID=A0A7T4R2S4_9GAMM|nr:NAD(P)-dependent oxidoreductase [Spongiibacter nanhainus]QQD19232.1 NAD(P)-dependent oxidoreductase [Spongiibacter nanhainus]
MNVAFIGLGTMGAPMAGHLLKSDCALRVYNRGAARAQQWSERFGAPVSQTVAEAVAEADVVALCLGADEDVRAMVSEHLLAHLKAGVVIVDHSTTSAALARDMSALCDKQQVAFIDAPVSGGQAGAEAGKLTVMAGGREEAFARIEPVLDGYAAKYRLVGESGAGQLAKMVNQVCIAGLLQGLAEGIHLGQSAGLDMEAVLDTISGGAAQSWQMDNRASTMLKGQYDFGFAVDWMRKDLGYVLDEARRQGASLPVTALVDQFYAQVQQLGGGRNDTSSLLRALQSSLKGEQH